MPMNKNVHGRKFYDVDFTSWDLHFRAVNIYDAIRKKGWQTNDVNSIVLRHFSIMSHRWPTEFRSCSIRSPYYGPSLLCKCHVSHIKLIIMWLSQQRNAATFKCFYISSHTAQTITMMVLHDVMMCICQAFQIEIFNQIAYSLYRNVWSVTDP